MSLSILSALQHNNMIGMGLFCSDGEDHAVRSVWESSEPFDEGFFLPSMQMTPSVVRTQQEHN